MKYFRNPSYGIDFTKCFPSGHRNCGSYEKIYLTNNLIGDHMPLLSALEALAIKPVLCVVAELLL